MVRASLISWVFATLFLALFVGCGAESAPSGAVSTSAPTAQKELQQIDATPRYAAPAESTASAELAAAVTEAAPSDPALNLGSQPLPMPAAVPPSDMPQVGKGIGPGEGGDKFAYIDENPFLVVKDTPLSTFSIDVDTAS